MDAEKKPPLIMKCPEQNRPGPFQYVKHTASNACAGNLSQYRIPIASQADRKQCQKQPKKEYRIFINKG